MSTRQKKHSFGYEALLLLVTLLWGTTFVAQSTAMDAIPPFAYVFARFLLSAVILLVITVVRQVIHKKRGRQDGKDGRDNAASRRRMHMTVFGGIATGAALFAASAAQQFGLITTTVGESSFITTFYIILVPIFGMFLGRRPAKSLWLAVIIALDGLYLISVEQGFSISVGNAYTLLSAFLFMVQILTIDHFSKEADLWWFAVIEFFTIAILALIATLLTEEAHLSDYRAAAGSILYAGLVSGAFCYTMQNVCQKHIEPTMASLIMGTEAVFATISGFVILHETLSPRKLIGCALVLTAVMLAERGRLSPAKRE